MANFNLNDDTCINRTSKFIFNRMKAEYLEAIENQVYSDEPTISMIYNELLQLGYWPAGADESHPEYEALHHGHLEYWFKESRFNFLYMILCAEGVV